MKLYLDIRHSGGGCTVGGHGELWEVPDSSGPLTRTEGCAKRAAAFHCQDATLAQVRNASVI